METSVTSSEDTSSGIQYGHATVTSSHMMLICDDVGASWRDLGTQLRLPSAVVRNVENDYTLCRERAWQVLDRWKQRNGTGATLGNLTDALEKIGKRNAAQRLVETEKVEAGLHCARVQSSKLRREVDLLRTGLQNEKQKHDTTVKELREFTKSLQEMLTEKGEDERQHIETRVQGLETTIKRLETYLSTEKTADKEVLMQETTRLGKICDQMEEGLRVVQENIKMISENQKEITGKSLQPENSAWEETSERRSSARQKGGMADRSQKDAGQRYGERQKNEGATIQLLYEGSQACLRCPDLEKELNDIKTKRETIKNKISQLELKHKEDKKKWDEDKKEKDKKIKENELEIGNLKKTNEKQQRQKERLSKKKAEMEKKKTEVMEENKKIMARIEKLLAEKEELEKALLVQTGAKEQERLKAENGMLLTRIEQLSKRVNNNELECKRLHEELKKYINFESRVFLPTGKEFATNCPGVICNLKRDVTSKLHASRSSDGPGKASDIFDHQKGTTSGTEERKDSWWSIDLGSSHRLVITHYSLRHGKRDGESVLTHWQLEGSNDGMNWKKLETNYKRADPPRFRDPHPYYTGTWSVEGKMGAFRFFRIFQTGRNSSHKYGIYLSGIELFGVLLNI